VRIKKGLDVPITGAPLQQIKDQIFTKKVAVLGTDFVGMKPTMHVQEGDTVKAGQLLFECKKVPGVRYTAPANGRVTALNRGAKRAFQSVVIEVTGNDHQAFEKYQRKATTDYSREEVRDLMNEAGLWSALRTRPFSKAPELDSTPSSIFITVTDSNPLAADASVVLAEYDDYFKAGVEVLSNLTEGTTYVCKNSRTTLPSFDGGNIEVKTFDGVHPAGNVGTHIHFLDAAGPNKTVWHIGYQDVIAVGVLFGTGKIWTERVVSLAGPGVKEPRLVKTRLGACLCELAEGQLTDGENRVISGSILSGTTSVGPFCYLGKFHTQVSVIKEGRERELLGWHSPGFDRFSLKCIYLSKLIPSKLFSFTSTTNGSPRAMVPVGLYEKVMPLDILPTQLLRALLTNDTDNAQKLGCLELDEEDLALCTFACPGKIDFGPVLRENLTIIEKEG
jgi:Na+-transporting NADH:ubiquinone oxidoreductase subunit A